MGPEMEFLTPKKLIFSKKSYFSAQIRIFPFCGEFSEKERKPFRAGKVVQNVDISWEISTFLKGAFFVKKVLPEMIKM